MTKTVQAPNSSVKSSSAMEDDSFCFTPCRRDANCTCKICQASINATLDLLPSSSHTKISSSKPSPPETPIFFDPCTMSTPKSDTSVLTVSPPVISTIRTDLRMKIKRKTGFGYGLAMMKCVLVLCLSLIGKLGFQFVSSRVMKTKMSPEIVRNLGEKSLEFQDVKEQLGFLTHELQNVLGTSVLEASSKIPNWEIVKDGLILRSRCQLHKSVTEEVSIWGWPLQTTGLLTTEFDSRSFTILSGRVTEWSNGELSGSIRKANTSWEQGKWSASVWRLEENTWILEYKRSFVFENTRPFSSAMEFFKFMMMKSFDWINQLCKFSNINHLAPT